jgi:tRNA threonylcarbamoyladenosine biosynthesis protein TsaB
VRILALDTATENCSVALLIESRVIAREQRLDRGHAGRILPMVDEVLASAGVTLEALSAIAFGRGPGAFTGVRLAASVTQGLAFAAGLAVVPISDLRALAQRALEADPTVTGVLACIDARMREVYWACYERNAGLASPLGDERLSSPEGVHLPDAWSRFGSAAVEGAGSAGATGGVAGATPETLCIGGAGSGFRAHPGLQSGLGRPLERLWPELLPRAAEIVQLAAAEVAQGRVYPPEQALPVYLRDEVVHPPRG